jgi:DNA-binding response OmpR family regulator
LVLVVEDDLKIADLVRLYLERAGYDVAVATDGFAGLRLMRQLNPALIVLDLMLPGVDGHTVARIAREETAVPIVMLTALGSWRQRVSGLDAGADDYVAKPFAPAELVARVRSVLRRTRPAMKPGILERGELRFEPGERRVTVAGVEVTLSPAELDLLAALFEAEGRVLTRDQIVDRLHPRGDWIDVRSIDVYVRRLRQKLGDAPARPRFVVTARGAGYRLGKG